MLPYKIATLCDLRDQQGRILLLRRNKAPNLGLYSPIGGKLDMPTGESPAQAAAREIHEEAGIQVPINRLHLSGLISETAYEGQTHWLLFYYRVLGPVWVEPQDIREGRLDWHHPRDVMALALPETDRRIIWPLVQQHDALSHETRPGFFAVHIDCTGSEMRWQVEQSEPPADRAATGGLI